MAGKVVPVRAGILVLVVALLAGGPFGPLAAGASSAPEGVLLVTYRDGARADDVARRAGASLLDDLPLVGVALVRDGPGVAALLARDRSVLAVEPDASVTAEGVAWNGAAWNGAAWNGAAWNGAAWNGAAWNGVSWNGAAWNGASWNGASWNGATWNGAQWNVEAWNDLAPPWGLFAIRAEEAWERGVPAHTRVVCVLDTGVDASHPALAPNLMEGYNALAPGAPPHDDEGHGTHLAGIVAAARDGSWPVPGVAAPLVAPVKVLDATGHGRTSDVIRGMSWCSSAGADVVLMAFTEDAPTRAFRDAVRALQRDGALVVASSGNGACERCVSSPASLPGVVGVGSFDPDGEVSPFTSEGPQMDLLAPGAFVTSAYPGGMLRTGSGTSQAAAFAAGAAALLWAHEPSWEAERVAAHLERTARDGRLDLAAAVETKGGAS